MGRIKLVINNKPCVIKADSEITIEEYSPIFEEVGAYSYPFSLDLDANRMLLGPMEQVACDETFEEKSPFYLDFEGVRILTGISEISTGNIKKEIEVNLNDKQREFLDVIKDVECRKLKQIRKVLIGTLRERAYSNKKYSDMGRGLLDSIIPYDVKNITNTTKIYGEMDFCSASVCCYKKTIHDQASDTVPFIVGYDRSASGICFFAMYLWDCIFKHFNIDINENALFNFEDFRRLACFTTSFHFERGEVVGTTQEYGKEYNLYATSDNFPNVKVEEFIKSMENAFGIKIIFRKDSNIVDVVLVDNIMRDKEILDMDLTILSASKAVEAKKKFTLKYSNNNDEDAGFFNFDYTIGPLYVRENIQKILDSVSPLPPYGVDYDMITGNTYGNPNIGNKNDNFDTGTERIENGKRLIGNKRGISVDPSNRGVGSDTSNHKTVWGEYNLAFAEVGAYNPVEVGDGSKEEIHEIGFDPVVCNLIIQNHKYTDAHNKAVMGVYVDDEVTDGLLVLEYNAHPQDRGYDLRRLEREVITTADLCDYDSGFTMGVLRGGGSTDGYAVIPDSIPDIGGQSYERVASNPAFSADSVDNFGNLYDYKGSGVEEDTPESERFSLKLSAVKDIKTDTYPDGLTPSKYPYRGLYHKFWANYAYFLCNRKKVTISIDASISQLVNLRWDKKYRIGQYVCYINKKTYTLSEDGIKDISLEIYIL